MTYFPAKRPMIAAIPLAILLLGAGATGFAQTPAPAPLAAASAAASAAAVAKAKARARAIAENKARAKAQAEEKAQAEAKAAAEAKAQAEEKAVADAKAAAEAKLVAEAKAAEEAKLAAEAKIAADAKAQAETEAAAIEAKERVQFADLPSFDRELAARLGPAPSINVVFYDRIKPSEIPDRLQKWMAAVEEGGGKVKVTAPPSTVTAKNPFLLISAVSSLFNLSKASKEAAFSAQFKPAHAYDADIRLKVDDRGDTVVDKVVFTQRLK